MIVQFYWCMICKIRTFIIYLYVYCAEMDTKLTIKLNSGVITRAKRYARYRRTSLSRLIESYLDSVTNEALEDIEITPLVRSLSGVIRLPEDFDYKKELADYLIRKYS